MVIPRVLIDLQAAFMADHAKADETDFTQGFCQPHFSLQCMHGSHPRCHGRKTDGAKAA